MTSQARTAFTQTLQCITGFLETVEKDFRRNRLSQLGPPNNANECFRNLLNYLEATGDQRLMFEHRIQNLQDSLFDIGSAVRGKVEKRLIFSNRAVEEIGRLFQESGAFLHTAIDFLLTDNSILLRWLENKQAECRALGDEYAASHEERLVEGICVPDASLSYLDMLHGFSGIQWEALNIIWLLAGVYGRNKAGRGHGAFAGSV